MNYCSNGNKNRLNLVEIDELKKKISIDFNHRTAQGRIEHGFGALVLLCSECYDFATVG